MAWDANVIRPVEDSVRQEMIDPDSTQFRNLRVLPGRGEDQRIVCGEVNSKNRLGGYVGFKHFVVVVGKGSNPDEVMISDSLLVPATYGLPERKLISSTCNVSAV
jgi:hypothetical protein